tara:strand:- start:53 stop:181 length:129 start_codon:yes stop_codon:yes gene_type:complete
LEKRAVDTKQKREKKGLTIRKRKSPLEALKGDLEHLRENAAL